MRWEISDACTAKTFYYSIFDNGCPGWSHVHDEYVAVVSHRTEWAGENTSKPCKKLQNSRRRNGVGGKAPSPVVGEVSGGEFLDESSHPHEAFRHEEGEFIIGQRFGSKVRFLVANGHRVSAGSPLASVSLDSPYAVPMKMAFSGQTGVVYGPDYSGHEVLAAYAPLPLENETFGIVAQISLEELKGPFFRANFAIFSIGVFSTLIGLALFYRVSEPIIESMQRSEKEYRELVEGANIIIARIDADGRLVFINRFAKQFMADKSDVEIGSRAEWLIDGQSEDGAEALGEFLDTLNDTQKTIELPIDFSPEHREWVDWTFKKVFENGGQFKELLCIGSVVTARRLARNAQKEIEERLRAIAKASPVGIIITDLNANLLYANERMHSLTSVTPSEIVGLGWLSIIKSEDRTRIQRSWFQPMTANLPPMEFRILRGTQEVWIFGQIVELKNDQGAAIGYVITLTDITDLKTAQSEQSRLSAAIEQAAEAILITDVKGRITYVNPAFEKITGYSKAEVKGKNPRMWGSGEHADAFYRDLWSTISSGEVWAGRIVNLRKDGQRYTEEATIGPVRDEKGEIVSYVCVAKDISDQLAIEAQLRQAQKLESIGELAAGIAHEINTPTQYVLSNTQFLEESFGTLIKMLENCKSLIAALQKGGDRDILLELADQALDENELQYLAEDIPDAFRESEDGLTRISEIVQSIKQLAHPGETIKSLHDINEIVTNAVTVTTNEWKYVADIETDLAPDLPGIYCLKGEIGQVLLNLIVNGAHAIEAKIGSNPEHKGVITLRTYQENDRIVLAVSDTGTGMPDTVLARAFDPFFTTKAVGQGTGQGLAIAHNVVVNMHDGEISIETEEGVGSTFFIKLPLE